MTPHATTREGRSQRACVMAPAVTPAAASCTAPGLRRAAMLSPKKAPPVSSITVGVAAAAKPQPRYWNTKRPPTMRAMVAHPVAIDTSARTLCAVAEYASHNKTSHHPETLDYDRTKVGHQGRHSGRQQQSTTQI